MQFIAQSSENGVIVNPILLFIILYFQTSIFVNTINHSRDKRKQKHPEEPFLI